MSLRSAILQDFWVHLAALIALAVGLVDLWAFHQLSHDTDLILMGGGFAGMGLKIVNGSTEKLRHALSASAAATAAAEARL